MHHEHLAMAGNAEAAAPAVAAGPVKMPGDDKDRLGVEKNTKIIRILTVIAYVCSVSMAAVFLSLYYGGLGYPGQSMYIYIKFQHFLI